MKILTEWLKAISYLVSNTLSLYLFFIIPYPIHTLCIYLSFAEHLLLYCPGHSVCGQRNNSFTVKCPDFTFNGTSFNLMREYWTVIGQISIKSNYVNFLDCELEHCSQALIQASSILTNIFSPVLFRIKNKSFQPNENKRKTYSTHNWFFYVNTVIQQIRVSPDVFV